MAVPKRRTAKTSRNMRRSHHALKSRLLTTCSRCRQPVPPHTACPNCGTYQGREILDVLTKLNKQERKAKERARNQPTT